MPSPVLKQSLGWLGALTVSIVDFPYAVRSRYSTSYARATATAAAAPGAGFVLGEGWGENARQEKRQRFSTDEPAARRLADLENTLRLIGLDGSEYVPLIAPLVDIAGRERGEARGGGVAAPAIGGADRVAAHWGAIAAGCARVRGPALGRSDLARSYAGSVRGRSARAAFRNRHPQVGSGSTPHDRRRAFRLATSIAFPSSRAPDQDGNVLTSLARAYSRLYSRSGLASARSNKLAIVLPIDAIFSPPLQDRPRRSVRDPQIPIGRALQSPPPRGFLLGRLSDAGPGASPPPSRNGPASKTPHQLRHTQSNPQCPVHVDSSRPLRANSDHSWTAL
jgi:hypothetical protein